MGGASRRCAATYAVKRAPSRHPEADTDVRSHIARLLSLAGNTRCRVGQHYRVGGALSTRRARLGVPQ